MGQFLLNPPSVEGWHEGEEWIDSGSLIERINYATSEISNKNAKGVKDIVDIVLQKNITNSDEILNNCLESLGYLEITENTKKIIQEHIEKNKFNSEEEKILDILKLIVSTPDFQYC